MSRDQTREFVYRIDASDMITDVNDAWVEFARHNGPESLTRAAVVGSSLWNHVSGVETQHVYQHLFERVRRGHRVSIPFRCDSPAVRRFHEMRMTSLDAGGIELACELLRQETRTPQPLALLESDVPRGGDLVVMCSSNSNEPSKLCSFCPNRHSRESRMLSANRAWRP